MPTLDAWFARYAESHRDPVNKALHWVCVPAITWSVIALAWWRSPYAAIALTALALAFYAYLSLPIALAMLVVVALVVASLVHAPVNVGAAAIVVFILAWLGQFAGHRIEGRKPAFLDDIKFLLIGPAWVLAFALRRLGLRY